MSVHPLQLLCALLRSPKQVGAVWPSSSALGRELVAEIVSPAVVVEVGAGTGAVSQVIEQRLCLASSAFYIERDPQLAALAAAKVSNGRVRCLDALDLDDHFDAASVDHVVCGLPWTNFDPAMQQRLLDCIIRLMRPDGTFSTFAYAHGLFLPRARRFAGLLEDRFCSVRRSSPVLRNLPPAYVYHCHTHPAG